MTIGSGVKKWFRMEFAYTATTESGVSSTETVSATFLIGNVFTNVHLAGVSTGGVRFGGYRRSTLKGFGMYEKALAMVYFACGTCRHLRLLHSAYKRLKR